MSDDPYRYVTEERPLFVERFCRACRLGGDREHSPCCPDYDGDDE